MAYLCLKKDLAFDLDRKREMAFGLNGLADRSSCNTLKREAQITDRYIEEDRANLSYHDEQNGVLEVRTGRHFVILHVGGKAIPNRKQT